MIKEGVLKCGEISISLNNIQAYKHISWSRADDIYMRFWHEIFHHGNFDEDHKKKLEKIINIIEGENNTIKLMIED